MAIWKMILQTAIILLITQSSIQSETIDRQHFLFKKLPDVAIPSFYTHVRIPFPLQPIINRLDEAIKELNHQKLVSALEKNKDITNTIYDNGIISLKRIKTEFTHLLQKFPAIPRNKRFFDIFGAFTGAAALGMAFYNAHNIKNLDADIQNLKEKHNQLVDITHLHDNHLRALDQEVETINAYWHSFFANNPTLINQHVQNIISEFHMQLLKVQDIFNFAIQSKFPASVLPPDTLDSIVNHLSAQAQQNKVESAVKSTLDILYMESSFLFSGKDSTITIILHCPFYDVTFQAIQYRAIPLNFEKQNNSFLIPDVGTNDIMVIRSESFFFLTSEQELNNCPLAGGIRFCKGRDTFQINLVDTCIGAIYMQKQSSISENCRFIQDPVKEHTFRIGKNTHLIITPDEYLKQMMCKGLMPKPVKIYNQLKLTIPGNCAIILKSHMLVGNPDTVDLEEQPIHLEWNLDLDQLNQTVSIPSALDNTMERLSIVETNITDFNTFKADNRTLFTDAILGSSLAGLLAIFIFGIGLHLFLFCRFTKKYKKLPQPESPIIRMQDLATPNAAECPTHPTPGLYPNLSTTSA
jgi:hypothetical protein